MIAVYNRTGTDSAGHGILSFGKSGVGSRIFSFSASATGNAISVYKYDDATAAKTANHGTAAMGMKIYSWICSGTLSNVWVNGIQNGTPDRDIDVGTCTLDQAAIGAVVSNGTLTTGLTGTLAEIVVYGRALTTSERINWERYFSLKWAI
jgi:hypothetical protein